jgi:hypothetical protein
MSVIISQNGKNATKLDKISFGLEGRLQEYIYDNPESIPLYDIKEDIKLLILAREFATNSGPIDAVGIDHDGEIYLVETKLYKNPDKRTVVAQVLDYGAALWKSSINLESFLSKLNYHTQNKFNQLATEKIKEYFELTDEQLEQVVDRVNTNLNEGSFKFVVMMDSMDDRLKDLIIYMNQNSKFDIYGVELEYYQHNNFEIMIPRLYGAEVKKDLSVQKPTNIYLSDDDFINAFNLNYQEPVRQILNLKDQITSQEIKIPGLVVKKTPKNIYFDFCRPSDENKILVIEIGIFNGIAGTDIRFHSNNSVDNSKLLNLINQTLGIPTQTIDPKHKYGMVAKWSLDDFSIDKFSDLIKALPTL